MQTDFGFEWVSFKDKTKRVKDLFTKVAPSYDIMNTAMSGGLHHLWKHSFVSSLPIQKGSKVLDVAGGTGDIALLIRSKFSYAAPHVTVCDLTPSMVQEGKRKSIDKGELGISWSCGDGQTLPFADNSFDVVTISFGLRNISKKEKALKEFHRVLKPGGFFYCLEFSKVKQELLKKIYAFYSFQIIPLLGKIIAKDEESYRYLVESIDRFFDPQTLEELIRNEGFFDVSHSPLSMGIVAIHKAKK